MTGGGIYPKNEREGKAMGNNDFYIPKNPKDWEANRDAVRELAREYQKNISEKSLSWGETNEYQIFFENIGAFYGILEEFRENGIC